MFVKVITDSGLYGVGEATLEYREPTVVQAIKELERYLVGKDPHNIEAFWHDAYRDAYWRGGVVLMSALAGVEMALWDIKGKDLGVPVYQLLGGKVRDSVKCYANAWFAGAKKPEEFAQKAKIAVKNGFSGLKWDPFGKEYLNIDPKHLNEALDCIAAVKDAVGDQVHLIIEGHGRFNVPTAGNGVGLDRRTIASCRPIDRQLYLGLCLHINSPCTWHFSINPGSSQAGNSRFHTGRDT